MIEHEPVSPIELDGVRFRDLDHDGEVAPYEDWRNPVDTRVDDLVGRMTIEEKVGHLLHGTIATDGPLGMLGIGHEYDIEAVRRHILGSGITSMISRLSRPPDQLAHQSNLLQAVAVEGRLGIPLTISTDPRNHFSTLAGASTDANGFSQWPGPLGLAATNDPDLVKGFADIVRQEYRAVGFHMALSPQADLATEPRWPRSDGTFGSDPELVSALVGAYVQGIQGGVGGLGAQSVVAVVKHWAGYGASRDGFDGHNYYGRFSAFPGGHFDDHVRAFLGAFEAGVAGVMPTYNILEGLRVDGGEVEAVGGGFSEHLLDGLLRGTHAFDGLVLSDWAITRDLTESGRTGVPPQQPRDVAMCWGVEQLSRPERFAKGMNAGIDQFGGEEDPEPFFAALENGLLVEERIDVAVRRVLTLKFELGLFENPFVDTGEAAATVGNDGFGLAAQTARRRSTVLLETDGQVAVAADDIVYLHGLADDAFRAVGIEVTDDINAATTAVVRVSTPSERLHPDFFFGARQSEGDLDFKDGDPDLEALRSISSRVPTTLVVHMNRPAILSDIRDLARVVIAEFGTTDPDLVANLTGSAPLVGGLPFELPRSMASVRAGHCDAPTGKDEPLYPLGFRALPGQPER
ncbi:MAG: glycoside hydrolase family 3 protein [Actinomycetia bacterium]|nr:glycoside hydrolase family 3 protein [Actinomycetes bacterium]